MNTKIAKIQFQFKLGVLIKVLLLFLKIEI